MKKSTLFGLGMAALFGLPVYAAWKARKGEAQVPPAGEFVWVNGVRLHYVRRGSGPLLVLLHGSDGFLQDYTFAVLEKLTSEYDVIAFDLPGHGYSGAVLDEAPTPQAQAQLLWGALRALGLVSESKNAPGGNQEKNGERPLIVGHSWGAGVALALALAHDDALAGLILLSGWIYPPQESPAPLLLLARTPLLGPLVTATLLPLVKPALIRHHLAQAFVPAPIPEAYARQAQALWQRYPWQTRVFARENTEDRAALAEMAARYDRLHLPIVLVVGEADAVADPAQHSIRLHRLLPQAELLLLPQAGHEIPQTHPEAVWEAVRRCRDATQEPRVASQQASPAAERQSVWGGNSDYTQARALVFRYGWNATAYQILNPQMQHWFGAAGESVVGYIRRAGVRVAAGAPICAPSQLAQIAQEFERDAAQNGEHVCWFGATDRLWRTLPPESRHSALVVGAQPVWNPGKWPEMLKTHRSLRAQLNRARNKGTQVSEWTQERADGDPGLQVCLEDWLNAHPFPTLHFLTEPVTLDRLADRRIWAAEDATGPVGFLIAAPIPSRKGWLIEQITRGARAPNGTAELLLDAAMRVFAAEDFEYVTLGLSPLSRRAQAAEGGDPPWLRLTLTWMRAHGRRFYNFEGLDAFKAKFRPDAWEPIYALSDEARFSLRTLYAIAAAFSGGTPLETFVRALLSALRQEFVWLHTRSQESHSPTEARRSAE